MSASYADMDDGRVGLQQQQQQQQQQAAGGGRGAGWALVEARLQGGAPWGFTLQGGLEHGEPLIISKVEEGGKADRLECPLQVRDEIIIINNIDLTGYRQEAIALVKGSHKTLHITVRREFDPGYIEEFGSSPPSYPSSFCAPSPPPLSSTPPPPPPHQQQQQKASQRTPCSTGGVQLRIKNRRSETSSRPHSWHSTKLGEGQRESDREGMDTMSSAWHHNYHASASATNLSGGFESDGLRKSPDQYSSRGSMESLDPPHPAHHQHHHALGHHVHSEPHPAYSSCQQLSYARSSNSIDHLHSKRDSAYSSFSTSSSIPEYLASAPAFGPERSSSLETMPQRGRGSGEMQQSDIRYIQTVYSGQQGHSQEQELSSGLDASLRDAKNGAKGGQSRDAPSGVCYRGSCSSGAVLATNRHSVGPIWPPGTSHSSCENLKGAPAPPRRSDSFAVTKNHERPNSWSSVEQTRATHRSLQKGSWHHSSGPVALSTAKGSCITEGQLHTVIEKSPESSPTTKPRQGFSPPGSPTGSSASQAPQSGRPVLPTGVYPVPQPEHHYAQIPSSSLMSPTTAVYPALAKGSNWQQGLQNVRGQEEDVNWRDGKLPHIEKGHQRNISSSHPFATISTIAATQSRAPESDRNQQESNLGHRPFPTEVKSESQAGANVSHRQQGPHFHSPNQLQMHSNHGPQSQLMQEQNFPSPQSQSAPVPRSQTCQERRDPYTPVHSGGQVRRSSDQSNLHSEAMSYSRVAQGQVPPSHSQGQHTSSTQSSLHYHHLEQIEQNPEKEHPLTRLENALVEGPIRSLSVLERVNRFEHCDRAGKQRSYSIGHGHHKNSFHRNQPTDKGQGGPCGTDDLKSMLERSARGNKAHRTMSYRGGSVNYKKDRTTTPDPSSALERSLSSLHLDGSREDDSQTSWKQDAQNTTSTSQDMRLYRDSLIDMQSKVLRSTSLRHNFPPVRSLRAASSPNPSSPGNHQPLPFPGNHYPSEKKGPKTMPKPSSIVITPPVTSPHTPKERHVVGPETRGPSPPALPSVPPVGAPALIRICGRKRLTSEQKKRSYSEPENMNEIGISDSGPFKIGGETSVADRRKMFELGFGNNAVSKPDLRQLQQDALAQYVRRKKNAKKDEGRERTGLRPLSAYVHSDSTYPSDTISLSSTSSLLSLQDSCLDRSLSSGDRRHFSSPGADLRSPDSHYYMGRETSPRPPSHPSPSGDFPSEQHTSSNQPAYSNYIQEEASNKQRATRSKDSQKTARPQQKPVRSKHASGSLAMAGSVLGSGKSASVEDLLERSEERLPSHSRSRSSPTLEILNQDSASDQVNTFHVFGSKTDDSAGDNGPVEGVSSPETSQNIHENPQRTPPSQGTVFSHYPVPLRDKHRHRNSERQRAHSMSSLAASVGLPCPLSPASTSQNGGGDERTASQANLDAITFPGVLTSDGGTQSGAVVTDKPTRHSLGDINISEDTTRALTPSPQPQLQFASTPNREDRGTMESRPLPGSPQNLSIQQQTPSFMFSDDLDDVFLKSPASVSPTPSVKETDLLLPPPALHEMYKRNSLQIPGSPPSLLPSPKSRSSTLTSTTSNMDALLLDETLHLEYEPFLKREKTVEDLQVDTLAQQLLMMDSSLAPILETWEGKSPVELVGEILQNNRLGAKVPWQTRFTPLNDSTLSRIKVKSQVDQRTNPEKEKDLNNKKVELCEALKCSVVALRQEKDALCKEQRHHQELGASIGSLVHKLCKINERDKYSMFIGDLEKIVNLLLSLCSRLSRIDKSLFALEGEELENEDVTAERDSLHHKRSQLLSQTEDARELKENLDRRQRVVHAILRGYLTDPQLRDYRRLVSTKPSLQIRRRNLEDLIRQREEQLSRLAETLPPELAASRDWSQGSLRSSPSLSCSSPFPELLPPSSPIPGHAHSSRSTTVTSL
ncbi:protein Shroom3 isoform X2 [Stigmatopora argus]